MKHKKGKYIYNFLYKQQNIGQCQRVLLIDKWSQSSEFIATLGTCPIYIIYKLFHTQNNGALENFQ